MMKWMTWMSRVMLVLIGVYWLATRRAPDLMSLSGDSELPKNSCVIGRVEAAWVVNRSGPLIWLASGDDETLSTIARVGVVRVLFQELKWAKEPNHAHLRLIGGITTFDGGA